MGLKNFRRIPVVEKGKLVGMVSLGDINRGLFFDKQHAADPSTPLEVAR
jgi:predicted transcriptional regulator